MWPKASVAPPRRATTHGSTATHKPAVVERARSLRLLLLLPLALGSLACAKSEERWREELADPDPFVRALAAIAVCELDPARAASAVPVLLDTVDRSELGMSEHAAAALAQSGPFVVHELLGALVSEEFMTLERRRAAMAALVAAGAQASAPIVATLRGPGRALAGELGLVLVQIGDPSVPPLIELLEREPDPALQTHAAWLLGQLGPRARAALPALETALSHPDPAVRKAASEALDRVGTASRGEAQQARPHQRRGP